jgi:hypothetical protein
MRLATGSSVHFSQRGLEPSLPLVGWDMLPYNIPVAEYHSTAAAFNLHLTRPVQPPSKS